ncbi:YbaK/EbsC family protein [Crenobacter sp. SG2303]|uniref:YbaK/EbsC family protein n=1 Tax=Crenobacter oryzisoli TaxID=3056844 RepID=A0ABT7XQG1_9NEIS|nr:YbaK/EbsC family protein [Crenobacter sp. SG2303]MDN0076038.1 YbaK/EbsC family protein [Crenobacter sp. SG2303]
MQTVFKSLMLLLEQANARFRVVTHALAGKSEDVALARGTEVGQGAKALVCEIHGEGAQARWVLAVLPADRKLDRQRLAQALGGHKAKLVDAAVATELTGCEIGAIPPFSFQSALQLVLDPELVERYDTIAFNAGRLDASILLDSQDFLAIAKPQLVRMSCPA